MEGKKEISRACNSNSQKLTRKQSCKITTAKLTNIFENLQHTSHYSKQFMSFNPLYPHSNSVKQMLLLSQFTDEQMEVQAFPGGSVVKNPPAMQEMQATLVGSLSWEDPLEENMATNSSILAWRIPWQRNLTGQRKQSRTELDMTEMTQHARRLKQRDVR